MESFYLKQLTNPHTILSILTDNYIKNTIGEVGYIDHPLVDYIGVFNKDEIQGVYMVINFSENEKEIHSYLLKKAIKKSRKYGDMIIDKCFEDDNITRLTAWIFADLTKAQNYVKKLGFKLEGIKKEAIMRRNKLTDVHLYGLTRSMR